MLVLFKLYKENIAINYFYCYRLRASISILSLWRWHILLTSVVGVMVTIHLLRPAEGKQLNKKLLPEEFIQHCIYLQILHNQQPKLLVYLPAQQLPHQVQHSCLQGLCIRRLGLFAWAMLGETVSRFRRPWLGSTSAAKSYRGSVGQDGEDVSIHQHPRTSIWLIFAQAGHSSLHVLCCSIYSIQLSIQRPFNWCVRVQQLALDQSLWAGSGSIVLWGWIRSHPPPSPHLFMSTVGLSLIRLTNNPSFRIFRKQSPLSRVSMPETRQAKRRATTTATTSIEETTAPDDRPKKRRKAVKSIGK